MLQSRNRMTELVETAQTAQTTAPGCQAKTLATSGAKAAGTAAAEAAAQAPADLHPCLVVRPCQGHQCEDQQKEMLIQCLLVHD
jgi:hypothetical protein